MKNRLKAGFCRKMADFCYFVSFRVPIEESFGWIEAGNHFGERAGYFKCLNG